MGAPGNTDPERQLIDAAWQARQRARCDYSHFAVGAALEDAAGNIWTGANVENASYTLGLCAERVALFYALAQGAEGFRKVVVVTDTPQVTTPCGACRQVLAEFAPDAEVIMATHSTVVRRAMAELLPWAFERSSLASVPE